MSDKERAISHLWQVSVPWHQVIPGAQRPEACPWSSSHPGFMQDAILAQWFCKDRWALAHGTDVRVMLLAGWLLHRESSLL